MPWENPPPQFQNQIYHTLEQAIREKMQVVLLYEGYVRELCPHALGEKKGVKKVLVYQFGGGSRKGDVPNWKCLSLDKITILTVREGKWCTDPARNAPKTCLDYVDIRVKY